jgi:hypothetical protein
VTAIRHRLKTSTSGTLIDITCRGNHPREHRGNRIPQLVTAPTRERVERRRSHPPPGGSSSGRIRPWRLTGGRSGSRPRSSSTRGTNANLWIASATDGGHRQRVPRDSMVSANRPSAGTVRDPRTWPPANSCGSRASTTRAPPARSARNSAVVSGRAVRAWSNSSRVLRLRTASKAK